MPVRRLWGKFFIKMSLVRLTIQCRFWVLRFSGRSEHTQVRKQRDKLIRRGNVSCKILLSKLIKTLRQRAFLTLSYDKSSRDLAKLYA